MNFTENYCITKNLNNIKKLIYLSFVLSLFVVSCKNDQKAKNQTKAAEEKEMTAEVVEKSQTFDATHTADLENSKITWHGYKPTGKHHGTVNLKNGSVAYNGDGLKDAYFEVDMGSIVVEDIPADDEYNAKLVGHLKSADFFDVAKFPVASFRMTEVKISDDGTYQVTGDFTINEVRKSISFPATLEKTDHGMLFKAEKVQLDRTDYGIKYKSKKFFDDLKDKFINDEFDFAFEVPLHAAK